jgi:hypothetical protein
MRGASHGGDHWLGFEKVSAQLALRRRQARLREHHWLRGARVAFRGAACRSSIVLGGMERASCMSAWLTGSRGHIT